MAALPLVGIRILSLAEQYPGPFATMLLADLGADVILVERPDGGDPSRRFAGLFTSLNRNKRSVALDLKSEAGRAQFLELVDSADVVIEGYRPGVMARLKLDADLLRARKPGLIYMSISSFGQTGPMAAVAGHDLSIQASAGMIKVPLGQEANANLPVLPLADISSAMFAALGVVTALFGRTRSGHGSQIDVSMFDSLVCWMTPFLVPAMNALEVRPLPPEDPGYGLFATADGRQITLSIAGEDHMWRALCDLLGLKQYSALTEQQRNHRAREIDPYLRAAIASCHFDWLCQHLETERIAFGPVCDVDQVVEDAQVKARNMVVEFDGKSKRERFIRQPLIFDGNIGTIRHSAPDLGEHGPAIFEALSAEELPDNVR
ncbi:CaiB/BaiF CoA transferase family protein [Glaciimonas immobilis]|uniref:Crotonobetainyl-CoA:carnitine CoA-transferase CaiB-like acyl-CoA transferase n=1 Tax=Glaciimonas immobilis TaxID=728004 RepID=A0A840RWX6_9BURK|nr:CoA transferase [Glaciimonas immobilis]KAF3996476.1 CoA transferase [Glaciimonas immobilis]MBB5201174.1 crotonobetainyl-CoA:carnitine CoA-transferase CaiB-like acyl-CoA transferase [Glaciimonas immobilis]